MLARFTFSVIVPKYGEKKMDLNADFKICQYLPLQIKMICRRFHIKTPTF